MKKLLGIVLSLIAIPALAGDVGRFPATGGEDGLPEVVFASLPTCNANTNGDKYTVTDCTAENDCSTGGGAHVEAMICDNGDSWQIWGDGTSASGADAVSIDHVTATDPDFSNEGSIDFIRCTGVGAPDEECVAAEDVILRSNRVIDWDPDVTGTTSAGLVEAIAAASSGDTIQMRCTGTYTISADTAFPIAWASGVSLEGCGPATPLTVSVNQTDIDEFILIENDTDVAINNLFIDGTNTCSSCAQGGVMISIQEGSERIRITNSLFVTDDDAGTDESQWRGIWITDTNESGTRVEPTDILVDNCTFSASTRGLEVSYGKNIRLTNNNFNFHVREPTHSEPGFGIIVHECQGCVIDSNTCDAGVYQTDAALSNSVTCYSMTEQSNATDADGNHGGRIFSNNSANKLWTGTTGLGIQGGQGDVVTGNLFQSGRCWTSSGPTEGHRGCYSDADCTDIGGTYICRNAAPIGIRCIAQDSEDNDSNRGSIIAMNTFGAGKGIDDAGTERIAGGWANQPIDIEEGSTDDDQCSDFFISGNVGTFTDSSQLIAAATVGPMVNFEGDTEDRNRAMANYWLEGESGGVDYNGIDIYTGLRVRNGTEDFCMSINAGGFYADDGAGAGTACNNTQDGDEQDMNAADLDLATYTISGGTADRCARFNTSGELESAGADCGAGGSGAFDDAADPVDLNTSTKDVIIGDTGMTSVVGKLEIGGDDDQTQLAVQAHSTQTGAVILVEDDSGGDLLSLASDGDLTIAGQLATGSSALPVNTFDDSDTASEQVDAQIGADATDTGAGSEDVDLTFSVQVNSVLTERLKIDADGNVEVTAQDGLAVNASDPPEAGSIRLDNAESVCWEAAPAGTDVCINVNASEQYQFDGLDCSAGDQYITADASGNLSCGTDNSAAGQAIILDLADDESNESADLGEIAVTGDTNSIFTEPSADKLLIGVASNWPTADSAEAVTSATGPTVDTTDNLAIDTTGGAVQDGQLLYYDGTQVRVVADVQQECKVIQDLAAADDNLPFFMNHAYEDITILEASCGCIIGTCTTEADISFDIDEVTSGTDSAVTGTVACEDMNAAGGPTGQALSVNVNMDRFDVLKFDVDNAVSPETDDYVICVSYEIVRK
ncbi:NOTCH2 protein [uncultured Mediterranean phage]|nr:NOTCH2 protein [uncultured Mediterranean phage]